MDKARLLGTRDVVHSHTIEGVGEVVFRPLSRETALRFQNKKVDAGLLEREVLAECLVDPELTQDEVAQWQKVSPAGEIQKLMDAVIKQSGMEVSAPKEAYKSAGE